MLLLTGMRRSLHHGTASRDEIVQTEQKKGTNRHSEGRGSGQSVRARMWITTEDSILEARPRGSYCSPDER